MKQVIFFALEGVICIYLCMAVANQQKVITGIVIAYFFLWQAVHRRKIKDQDEIIDRLLKMEMDHNKKMLDIGREALNGKEKSKR